MKRTLVNEIVVGKKVRIQGWVHEIRKQSKITFLVIRDRSGLMQAVLKDSDLDLTKESVIDIIAKVKKAVIKNPEVTIKKAELLIEEIKVLSKAEPNLPIQVVKGKDKADLSTRLDWRWLDLRKPKKMLVFKIWNTMEIVMREWWEKNGYTQIYSPKFMGAPSESGAELFSVEYFGKKAFLAQSPQFYKQMAMASGFEKIFEIGPVFRANPSHTSRHDTEFTMIDMELSFIESHKDVMKAEEQWIQHTMKKLKKDHGKEIEETFGVEVTVPKTPFPRITMKEAIKLIGKKGIEDLDAESEKLLSEAIKKKYKHEFVFVTEYPYSVRPFYHMKIGKDLTKSYDLVWKGLEITTGAQREHRHEILKAQAKEKGLDMKPIEDYLNFFKYGCPPHGGFGLSPTRMLIILLNLGNVREATFLPRDTERLRP